ncbi:MAG: MarR family winged helix-turn-helix transcriptional regulator [Chloroflexota bacterium]|nr:MarR family winged helix-turn-helix transcriptional regulator [Chloroflexota bacterium]
MQIAHTYRTLMHTFEQRVGISHARLLILSVLLLEKEVSQGMLQQRVQVDGAAITRQVRQMEVEGLLERRPAPHDNRSTLVALTPTGRQVAGELLAAREIFESAMTEGLSQEEIAILRHALYHIHKNTTRAGTGK